MLIGSPTVVISPSQFLLDFYLARGFFRHSTCVVVRNPVTFQPQALRHFDQRFAFHFLYVGQIESHKGVQLLVEAFTALMSDIPTGSAMLHIVGNGSLLGSIKETVGDTHMIKVYGRVERSDLPALFSLANMTVVPSLCYENSPTVIFESFACGVPVIASNIEGIAELIREGDNGLTFEAGNVAALKAKMRWAYDHQPLVRAMGERTGQSLLGLGLTEYIGKLESLFSSAVNAPRLASE
jgi:glycosyltransferase involved in cell wall biosynthesis